MQRDLVERARKGDHDAFAELAGATISRLDSAAWLILRDPDKAKDAVQNALLRAWRDLPTLRDPDRFDPTTELGAGTITGAPEILYPTWSPDGTWIAFVGAIRGSAAGIIAIIHPDGTGYRPLQTSAETGDGGSLAWSPDPTVQRLLFIGPGRSVDVLDVATEEKRSVGEGFWLTWSLSGDRVSYWNDGTQIVGSGFDAAGRPPVRPYPSFTGNCQDHPALARTAFCGPASWSPDGTRVIATDIGGHVILSLLADGSGSPILVELDAAPEGLWGNVAWQPIRD